MRKLTSLTLLTRPRRGGLPAARACWSLWVTGMRGMGALVFRLRGRFVGHCIAASGALIFTAGAGALTVPPEDPLAGNSPSGYLDHFVRENEGKGTIGIPPIPRFDAKGTQSSPPKRDGDFSAGDVFVEDILPASSKWTSDTARKLQAPPLQNWRDGNDKLLSADNTLVREIASLYISRRPERSIANAAAMEQGAPQGAERGRSHGTTLSQWFDPVETALTLALAPETEDLIRNVVRPVIGPTNHINFSLLGFGEFHIPLTKGSAALSFGGPPGDAASFSPSSRNGSGAKGPGVASFRSPMNRGKEAGATQEVLPQAMSLSEFARILFRDVLGVLANPVSILSALVIGACVFGFQWVMARGR